MTTYYYNTKSKQRPRSIITNFNSESWDNGSPKSMETPPSRRLSNQHVPYFSLFSTPTWQTTFTYQHEQQEEEQKSPPIDFDFLNHEKDYFFQNHLWAYPQKEQEKPLLTPPPQSPTRQKIDDYFSPSVVDIHGLGKGLFLNQLKDSQRIYQVGFKNKQDYFYTDDKFQINDKVVVEADRGYDIGIVLQEELNTTTAATAIILAQKKKKSSNNSPNNETPTVIRRIFRLANPIELDTMEKKKGDEEKALALCQAKIKQKGLPMQVVSAEYQWDRRKLTFYFKADERIDFRELVRELFKIYKTRIWMCASNSTN